MKPQPWQEDLCCRERLSPLGGGVQWFSLGFGSEVVLLLSLYYFNSEALGTLYLLSVVLSLSHDFDLWTNTSWIFISIFSHPGKLQSHLKKQDTNWNKGIWWKRQVKKINETSSFLAQKWIRWVKVVEHLQHTVQEAEWQSNVPPIKETKSQDKNSMGLIAALNALF